MRSESLGAASPVRDTSVAMETDVALVGIPEIPPVGIPGGQVHDTPGSPIEAAMCMADPRMDEEVNVEHIPSHQHPLEGVYLSLAAPNSRSPKSVILKAVDGAQHKILVAMYSFTDPDYVHALVQAAARNVEVYLVLDEEQARGKSVWQSMDLRQELLTGGVHVRLSGGHGFGGSCHLKLLLVDDALVGTGSFNWSKRASTESYENWIMSTNEATLQDHMKLFKTIWQRGRPQRAWVPLSHIQGPPAAKRLSRNPMAP